MRLTPELARAVAQDAGNRAMRAAGRSTWTRADFQTAAQTLAAIWPLGDCPTCDGYAIHASEAPFCPSCARERKGSGLTFLFLLAERSK